MSVIYPENPESGGGSRIKPSLTDFLLARIAEDEEVARTAIGEYRSAQWHLGEDDETVLMYPPSSPEKIAAVRERFGDDQADEHARWGGETIQVAGDEVAPHIARHNPARVLAECEAKRRMVERHSTHLGAVNESHPVHHATFRPGCDTLRILALPYADHPDYRDEWRP